MDLPRPPTRRRPLNDAASRVNSETSTPPSRTKGNKFHLSSSPGPARLPHNESLMPDLTVRNPAADNRRVANVMSEDNSNRNSAISNASTNASGTTRRRKTHIGPWQLGKTIGEGGCSRVRVVRHSTTNQYGAAKIISKKMAEKVKAQSLMHLYQSAEQDARLMSNMKLLPFGLEREIVIMKLLEHGNIVKLYDVWENRNELYLIMEFVSGGELFDYIEDNRGLEEIEVVYLFRQIVAALLYCHRLHIHHRDLKPENILLDKNTFQIKLVDFGMAALQPEGRFLSTPCGSPHYAAPEVLKYKKYDGGQADVWSCGVILFVMLTGGPPFSFNYNDNEDLHDLFKLIESATYDMPEDLSREAQDLISKILVPDPKHRITMDGVWDHPFMQKYNEEFGFGPKESRADFWIGPRPKIEDWNIRRLEDIDREILRNMRTLWHSDTQESVIQKLLSREPNQEKYFYNALVKHREEHLENYAGGADGMGYSASDYHHGGYVPPRDNEPPMPRQQRSKSQFSILNNEHLRSEHSFSEPPPSELSYDPFRASRAPSVATTTKNGYTNVTVHRGSSNNSRSYKSVAVQNALGPANAQRVEALKRARQRSSGLSSAGSRNSRSAKPGSRPTSKRGSILSGSRSSLASSNWLTSASMTTKPSVAHKRGVSFVHLRRSSTMSGLTAEASEQTSEQKKAASNASKTSTTQDTSRDVQPTPATSSSQYTPSERQYLTSLVQETEPAAPQQSVLGHTNHSSDLRSKKEGKVVPHLKVRVPPNPGHYIEGEARKVSAELERTMDEAFNRSSISSSARTSVTDKPSPYTYETPPSSVSNRGSGTPSYRPDRSVSPFDPALRNRPLPPLPTKEKESPSTFIAKELAETRAKLAARYAVEGGENYDEVLAHLDRLLHAPQKKPVAEQPVGKRIVSAPQPTRTPDSVEHLPIISEEGIASETTPRPDWGRNAYRAVTAPTGNTHGQNAAPANHGSRYYAENSIRLVDPTSPTPIAPLQIRKKSSLAAIKESASTPRTASPLQSHPVAPSQLGDNQTSDMRPPTFAETVLKGKSAAVNGNRSTVFGGKSDNPVKKRSWFRRKRTDQDENVDETDATLKIPQQWLGLDDRMQTASPAVGSKNRGSKKSEAAMTSSTEFPMREEKAGGATGGKKGFFKMFGMGKEKKNGAVSKMELGSQSTTPDGSRSFVSAAFDLPENEDPSDAAALEAQNWLARFLHIKPAMQTVCFHVGRGRARSELVRTLRDWRRFGVSNVQLDRKTNTIRATVDKDNHLKIKPVQFMAELFVVLRQGRHSQLCLVRFTQTRGAASSFRRVVQILEEVYGSRGMLVEDEDIKGQMNDVLTQ